MECGTDSVAEWNQLYGTILYARNCVLFHESGLKRSTCISALEKPESNNCENESGDILFNECSAQHMLKYRILYICWCSLSRKYSVKF